MLRRSGFIAAMGICLACSENATDNLSSWEDDADKESSRDLSGDSEVWVTLADDTAKNFEEHVATLKKQPRVIRLYSENGVTALKLRESQIGLLGEMIHLKSHRCGGFQAHESEQGAIDALTIPAAPQTQAVSYSIDNGGEVRKLMKTLSSAKMLETVTQLSSFKNRYYTAQTGVDSQLWLKGHWESLVAGRTDATVEVFQHSAWAQPSIILTFTGKTFPNEVVVLGAHGDSINQMNRTGPAPGSDDDASGVATLTDVIRSMVVNGFRPERTVKIMSYAAEEAGLRGSKDIVSKYKASNVNVIGVMQLDMTNYKGSASDIVIYTDFTNPGQNEFVSELIDTYVQVVRDTAQCGYGCSDHASWHNAGFATSMPFEALFDDANPKIHTANDNLAFMGNSMENSLKFGKMAAAFVAELAKGSSGGTSNDTTPPTVALTAPAANSQVSGTVTVSADASDNVAVAKVEFLLDGNVLGSDGTAPYSFDWNTANTSNGSHVLVAVAYDSSQNVARTSGNSVTVSNQAASTAVYDPARKAPACATVSSGCDSGNLLTGRGNVGPEANAPNTINLSCVDGHSGSFHRDESLDRLKVSTPDGQPFRAGGTVKIEALVWAYSSFTADSLDLYAADDAAAPTWRLIGTLSPTAAGAQTLTATYTLGTGSAQAIRGRMRYGGTASSCASGSYDDVDDLVFAVQP